jgi:hypothetical protein
MRGNETLSDGLDQVARCAKRPGRAKGSQSCGWQAAPPDDGFVPSAAVWARRKAYQITPNRFIQASWQDTIEEATQ